MSDASAATAAPAASMPPASAEPSAPTPVLELGQRDFVFAGGGRALAGLAAKNAALNVATLFLYRFWARSQTRRAIWSRVIIGGDPLEYSGRALELFIGAIFIAAFILAPLALASFAVEIARAFWNAPLLYLWGPGVYVLLRGVVGMALFRARRYRLRRTLWRGVRFNQTGSAWLYGLKALGYFVLSALTLGWALPWRRKALARHLWRRTWFGDARFAIEKAPSEIYANFALGWLCTGAFALVGWPAASLAGALIAVAFASIAPWAAAAAMVASVAASILIAAVFVQWIFSYYEAAVLRWIAKSVRLGDARFELLLTGGRMAALRTSNVVLMAFTLGFAQPVAQARRAKLIVDSLRIAGDVDPAAIGASDVSGADGGEGLADAFDIGAI